MDENGYAGQIPLAMSHHYNPRNFCGHSFMLTPILGHHPVATKEYFQKGPTEGVRLSLMNGKIGVHGDVS